MLLCKVGKWPTQTPLRRDISVAGRKQMRPLTWLVIGDLHACTSLMTHDLELGPAPTPSGARAEDTGRTASRAKPQRPSVHLEPDRPPPDVCSNRRNLQNVTQTSPCFLQNQHGNSQAQHLRASGSRKETLSGCVCT